MEIDGHTAGCIGIVDVFAPLTPGQCGVARQVRDLLQDYLRRNMRNLLLEEASKGFWFDLITGRSFERDQLNEKLSARGWRCDENFLMLSFLLVEPYHSQVELSAAMNRTLMEFPPGNRRRGGSGHHPAAP